MDTEKKFLKTVKKFKLLDKEDKILVAFSGGPDSVVLTYLLLKFKDYLNIDKISLAHLNHKLRKESDLDESFCVDFAKSYGLEIFTKKVDIRKIAKDERISIEEAGRKERYKFFDEISKKEGFNKIATAHHLSDLAETMTLWFLQGSKRGLKGFRQRSSNLIRPIFYLTKEEILNYCEERKLNYVVDISNFSDKYLRNKVRLKVIPVLKQINSSLEISLERMSYFINIDEEFFDKQVDMIMTDIKGNFLPYEKLNNLDDALVYRIFQRWLESNSIPPSYEHLRQILEFFHSGRTEKYISLPSNKKLVFTEKGYKIVENIEKEGFLYKLKVGERIYIKEADSWIEAFRVEKVDIDALKKDCNTVCFDLEADEFTVRSKEEGDRIIPFGHSSEKKLKDIFIDMKIPKNQRNRIPILVFGDKILWVCGYKRSALYPVNEKSTNIICFRLVKEV